MMTTAPTGLSVALTSKGLLPGILVDAGSLRTVGHKVMLLDKNPCCQRDSPGSGCTAVVAALEVVLARIQSDLRIHAVDKTVEHTAAGGVPPTPRLQDMVAPQIQPCPSRS